ncbi:MAG: YlxR family protein, partial [Eubacteriaceae bacterium]
MKKIPQRTCIICHSKFDKKDLLRIVLNKEGEIFYDPTGKANGRGTYLCK